MRLLIALFRPARIEFSHADQAHDVRRPLGAMQKRGVNLGDHDGGGLLKFMLTVRTWTYEM